MVLVLNSLGLLITGVLVMDPLQSSRPQGEQVEPGVTRTDPPAPPPPPQNPGDNAGAVNANPPADWQQMFHEMRSVILRQEEELQRLRQQVDPVDQVLPLHLCQWWVTKGILCSTGTLCSSGL